MTMTTKTTAPQQKPKGRPFGSGTGGRKTLTDAIPRTRCAPELRAKFDALGGADWLRAAIERDYAAKKKQ